VVPFAFSFQNIFSIPTFLFFSFIVTSNTRTQNKALLALGAVATLYPDLVLRHVMPVFTFMGASTIRHDDNYTFTVMQKSLRAILPSMVKQGGIGVSDVLRIFVDNFQHVPLHRRLHLFASVLQTLSLKYLPDLLLLFLVKHVTQVNPPYTIFLHFLFLKSIILFAWSLGSSAADSGQARPISFHRRGRSRRP
jgi:hypothetical protein